MYALTGCRVISHVTSASKARTTLAELWSSESPAPLASGSRIGRKHQELAAGNLPSILDPDTVLFLGSGSGRNTRLQCPQGGEIQDCVSGCDGLYFSGSENL